MLWTALGLLVATIVSIEEAMTSEKPHRIKTLVVLLAIAGLAVGTVSAISENKDKESAQKTVKELTDKLDSQKPLLDLINITVGDLGMLNRLSRGQKYYVRIAAGHTEEELAPYFKRISNNFPGAEPNNLVAIRGPRPGSANFELVFGQHLDPAAAEVFSRLATTNGFTPAGQPAAIFRESD
jgi:hypothetical protein